MPTDTIELARILPSTPERIFAAWLDAAEHTAMTGSPATVESAEVGGRFTAWDGYIDGSLLAFEPGVRIVQSWRSDDFPADALDSLLEVRLEPAPGGTRVTLRHSDLPEGAGPALLEGWEEFYFEPMERYFARVARPVVRGSKKKARVKAQPASRKGAPRKASRKPARKVAKAAPRKGAARRAAAKPVKKAARRPAKRKDARRR
jgi:uncharacterized protein YndB with AHSA1/START domain